MGGKKPKLRNLMPQSQQQNEADIEGVQQMAMKAAQSFKPANQTQSSLLERKKSKDRLIAMPNKGIPIKNKVSNMEVSKPDTRKSS